jgi:hypothetical protein
VALAEGLATHLHKDCLMPLSQSDRGFLKKVYKDLGDEPLQPDSPFYEPIYEALGLDDPVQQISTLIDFGGVQSMRLFSGFRGSGKTTELLRLKRKLEAQAAPVNRLTRFLDSHFVLYFVNGKEWYDIHPLIREEVMDVMQAPPPVAEC